MSTVVTFRRWKRLESHHAPYAQNQLLKSGKSATALFAISKDARWRLFLKAQIKKSRRCEKRERREWRKRSERECTWRRLVKCVQREPSFRLVLLIYLFHSRTHVAREKVRAKRGADDAYTHLVQLSCFHCIGDRVQVCGRVAIITFSLFHPCIWVSLSLSVSFAFFLLCSAKATLDRWENSARKRDASTRKFHLHFTRGGNGQHAKLFYWCLSATLNANLTQ